MFPAWLAAAVLTFGCATARPPAPPPQPAWPDHATYVAGELRRCEAGDRDVCRGLTVESDPTISLRAGEQGCALGDPFCCTWVSSVLRTSDPARSEALRWRACDALHDFQACADLAHGFNPAGTGPGPHADAAAIDLCRLGPKSDIACGPALLRLQHAPDEEVDPLVDILLCGSPGPGCDEAAARFFLFDGGRYGQLRPEHGISRLDRACRAGRGPACASEAELLYGGQLVPARRDDAVGLARASCDAGAPESCFFLARVALAPGKRHDLTAAITGFEKACGSSAECASDAGERLAAHGHLREARAFFSRACDQGDAGGCEDLGRVRVLRGERGPEVRRLLEGPCGAGAQEACRALAAITTGKEARRYRELGAERAPLTDAVRASYARSWRGEPTGGDTALLAATIMTGGFPAIFAIRPRPRTGFGFSRDDFPDP